MEMTQECKSCRYVVTHSESDGTVPFYCHRHPPVCGGTSEHTYTAWPKVGGFDWCGEYERNIQHIYPKERV